MLYVVRKQKRVHGHSFSSTHPRTPVTPAYVDAKMLSSKSYQSHQNSRALRTTLRWLTWMWSFPITLTGFGTGPSLERVHTASLCVSVWGQPGRDFTFLEKSASSFMIIHEIMHAQSALKVHLKKKIVFNCFQLTEELHWCRTEPWVWPYRTECQFEHRFRYVTTVRIGQKIESHVNIKKTVIMTGFGGSLSRFTGCP